MLNCMIHKSSYCKCSIARCQVRPFLLFIIRTHPLQMKKYPLQYASTDKNKKSHSSKARKVKRVSKVKYARTCICHEIICWRIFFSVFPLCKIALKYHHFYKQVHSLIVSAENLNKITFLRRQLSTLYGIYELLHVTISFFPKTRVRFWW